MHIPDVIYVSGVRIPVIQKRERFEVVTHDGEKVLACGHYSPDPGDITIVVPEDNPSVGGILFYHEVIEAMNHWSEIGLTHKQISSLSANLYSTFGAVA